MRTKAKWTVAGLLALGASLGGVRSWAGNTSATANLMIDVTVNANVSVIINSVVNSSVSVPSVTPGGAAVISPSSSTVSNNGTGVTEFWKLSSANAIDSNTNGAGWTLASSTGTMDQFALQALFISSNAAANDCTATVAAADWNQAYAAPLTATPVYYRSSSYASGAMFADQTTIGTVKGNPDYASGGLNDGRMMPSSAGGGAGVRGFCYRIMPPASVSGLDNQILYVTVTAI